MPKKAQIFDLDAIRVHLDDGDGVAALEAALDGWRQTHAPELADLIDHISAAISGPPITDETEWTTVARGRDAASLGRLLAGATSLPASFLPTAGTMLGAFADDPRIAMAVATWSLDPPTTSSSTHSFWTRTIDAMTRIGDPRVVPVLKKRLRMKQGGSKFWPRLYGAIEKAIPKIAKANVAPVDGKLVAKLGKAAAKLEAVAPKKPPKPQKAEGLAQATTHLEAGRVEAAIDAMCAAWRDQRVPAIADAIDRATKLLPSWGRPLGMTDKESHAAWMTAFADNATGNLPQLLEHVMVGGPANAERHLLELSSLPDDPRIGWRLAELCARYAARPSRTQFWRTLLELVARTRDGRTAGSLRCAFHDFTVNSLDHYKQANRIIAAWAMSPPVPPAIGPKDTDELAKISRALDTLETQRDDTERKLLGAIIDMWDDNGPRLVYADWLMERGSPRGQAIAMLAQPNPDPKVGAWLRKNTVIYGYLEDVGRLWNTDRYLALDRGLPTAVRVEWSTNTLFWRRMLDYPLWSLIETIDMSGMSDGDWNGPPVDDFARLIVAPTSRRLRTIRYPARMPAFVAKLMPLVDGKWRPYENDLVRVC